GVDVTIRIAQLADSTLIARRLAPAQRVIVASPAYIEHHGMPAEPADLMQHRCLNYGHSTALQRWQLTREGETISVTTNCIMCSNNGDVLRAAALAGQGLSQLPTFLVGPDIAAGKLRTILDDLRPPALGIFALYAPNRYLAAKV